MSTYPISNVITLNQNNTRYTYTIIKEGYYPQNSILQYTSARSCNNTQFKIPDNYLIQTSWGRGASKHVIQCEINYIEEVPVFKILFGENFQLCVKSTQSATSAANAYLQMKKPNTQARLSGIHIFFLNSQELERERERKHRSHLLKPFNKLSNSMKTKRVYMFNEHLAVNFTNTATKYFHSDDRLTLQEMCFAVQDKNFQANFGVQNKEKENQQNEAFVKVIDQGPIARDSYRNLAALEPKLPRETTIYKTKKRINEEMNNAIPISILNVTDQPSFTPIDENPDINDPEVIEEVLKYIGKAEYCKITDILLFVLPDLIERHVVNQDNPIINLYISGDGRNVGRKVKHVIITCTILDDIVNIYKAEHHYTIILFPGNENYILLQKMITPIAYELNDLVLNGLKDLNGTVWKINPYFSSDWKFMAIILGFI
ncbi:unnamed protein product [Rhizophagus irregularis]|nr:unnamed protein product [Rhizophagus irregularis]